MTLRRFRDQPPRKLTTTPAGKPAGFHWRRQWRMVARIANEYDLTRDWWRENPIDRRDYDLATRDGLICTVYHERTADTWHLGAIRD